MGKDKQEKEEEGEEEMSLGICCSRFENCLYHRPFVRL